jgi:hypothetical protein
MHTYMHMLSSVQLHRLLAESPLIPYFHATYFGHTGPTAKNYDIHPMLGNYRETSNYTTDVTE